MKAIVFLALQSAVSSFHADTCYFPAWSPDGRNIAFEVRIDGEWRVAAIGADGGSLRLLTGAGANYRSPSWSADGRKLAVVSDRDGDWDLFVIEADGTRPRRLTHDPVQESSPSWSPDGRWLAYIREGEGARELLVVDVVDPRGARTLRLHHDHPAVGSRLSWAPDGGRLSWFSPERPAEEASPTRLTIATLSPARDTAAPAVSVSVAAKGSPFRDFNPAWSRDGWVVFDAHERGAWESEDGGWEIWAMREDGSERRRLTENRVNDWGPAVSPDGRFIAFASGMNDRYEIWIMDRDGSRPRRLTHVVYPGAAPGETGNPSPARLNGERRAGEALQRSSLRPRNGLKSSSGPARERARPGRRD